MQSTAKGIDIGEREMHALLGFCGETQALAQVLFKVKGKRVIACAANGRAAVEYTGTNEGGVEGEFPVSRSFLELCAHAAVEGSKHVPAQIARLLVNRTIAAAVVVFKESGKEGPTLTNPDEIEPSTQLKFKHVHDLLDFDADRKGHWFATDMRHTKPLTAVQMAADKCPITWVPAADELSPIGFLAKGSGGEWRGILKPVETAGPGKTATNPEPEDDDQDDRQPDLFESREGKAGDDDAADEGDGIITDAEAAALAKKNGKGKGKAKVKNRAQATS
jgi:hypothetical protein